MQSLAVCKTDVGLKRKNNQDSILVDEDLHLYAVADGMGGHKGGEVASQLALDTVQAFIKENSQMPPKELLKKAYQKACAQVFDESQKDSTLRGMGTTLVVCLVRGRTVYIANVGDSRAYLYKDQKLWLLTEDHSLVNEQLKSGLIEEKDVESFEAKNIITRSVGYEREVVCDVVEREVDGVEYFVLSSDGLHGLVNDEKILELCRENEYHQWPDLMINEAKNAGGDDNISVVAVFTKVANKGD